MCNFHKRTESNRSKTIKFPSNFLRPPAPPPFFGRVRKFLILRARPEGVHPSRGGVDDLIKIL